MNPFEQSLLNFYTEEQLQKIQSAKIGIAGAGGLGSNLAIMLVRSGFKNIEIIDHDTIEASNLNRQQYFLSEVGNIKVAVLAKHLQKINPDVKIETHTKKWEINTANTFFQKCDIVAECFDNPITKRNFVEYYQKKVRFIVTGNGMSGLNDNLRIAIKKVENIFIVGDNISDTEKNNTPFAPRVTLCAAKMANIMLNNVIGPINETSS